MPDGINLSESVVWCHKVITGGETGQAQK